MFGRGHSLYQDKYKRRRPDSNWGTGLCRPLPQPLGHAARRLATLLLAALGLATALSCPRACGPGGYVWAVALSTLERRTKCAGATIVTPVGYDTAR